MLVKLFNMFKKVLPSEVFHSGFILSHVLFLLGLDPAQPCFWTNDLTERLDHTDADFVDIIHTNGRLMSKIGFGFPDRTGKVCFMITV